MQTTLNFEPATRGELANILAMLQLKPKPILRKDLSVMMGISERRLRMLIGELNTLGFPVVSCGSGFFLSQNAEDTKHAAARLRSQALAMLKRAACLEKTSPKYQAEQIIMELR